MSQLIMKSRKTIPASRSQGTTALNAIRLLALLLSIGLIIGFQEKGESLLTPDRTAKLKLAQEHSQAARELRKHGRLDQAEQRCREAIALVRESGWAASGERALLGMILWEKGLKREGFETLKNSYPKSHGSAEKELYLAIIALDLNEIETASQSLKYFMEGSVSVNSVWHELRVYWPKGNTLPSLRAAIYFLEGSRLVEERLEGVQKGISYLKQAHQIEPKNIAIQFNLARAYRQIKDFGAAAPFYKFVRDNAEGHLQRISSTEYSRFKNVKPKAALNPPVASGRGGS